MCCLVVAERRFYDAENGGKTLFMLRISVKYLQYLLCTGTLGIQTHTHTHTVTGAQPISKTPINNTPAPAQRTRPMSAEARPTTTIQESNPDTHMPQASETTHEQLISMHMPTGRMHASASRPQTAAQGRREDASGKRVIAYDNNNNNSKQEMVEASLMRRERPRTAGVTPHKAAAGVNRQRKLLALDDSNRVGARNRGGNMQDAVQESVGVYKAQDRMMMRIPQGVGYADGQVRKPSLTEDYDWCVCVCVCACICVSFFAFVCSLQV